YNRQNPVPHPLPKDKTISTVRTKSTPKSDGFNEIRFQDLAGKEEIYVHAQNALDEVVLGGHSTSVGGDQSNTVGGHRTHTVAKWERIEVRGNQDTLILGKDGLTVVESRSAEINGMDNHKAQGLKSEVSDNYEFHSSNTYFTTGDFQVNGQTAAFWEAAQ